MLFVYTEFGHFLANYHLEKAMPPQDNEIKTMIHLHHHDLA